MIKRAYLGSTLVYQYNSYEPDTVLCDINNGASASVIFKKVFIMFEDKVPAVAAAEMVTSATDKAAAREQVLKDISTLRETWAQFL